MRILSLPSLRLPQLFDFPRIRVLLLTWSGAFLPVILEQLARENGTLFSDRFKPCITKRDEKEKKQCVVQFLGKEMSTSSFAMYTFSAAVLVQAVMLICGSSFADYGTYQHSLCFPLMMLMVLEGPYRKKMLITFAYVGSIASALFIFITPTVFYLAPILVIMGVTSLGFSFVLLNAFLPLLVANHGSRSTTGDYELDSLSPSSSGLRSKKSDADQLSRDLELSAQISSKGTGYGYISAVFVQVISILILFLFSKTSLQEAYPSLPIRVVLLLVGIWWAALTTPTLLHLRERPGPPLPMQESGFAAKPSRLRTMLFFMMFSLRAFWGTLRRAIRLRQTVIFLVAWFLLSDAVATISGTAVLFARTELHMSTIAVALLSITSIGSGIVGAFAWPRVQRRYALQPKTVLLCCVAGMEIIPLYGLLGFLPVFKKLGFIGLQQAWEIYPIAVLHGIVMGGISSYARSVYAPLIPEGSEASFFALYAVTDKGSSAVGPALVGWIVDNAGSIRPAFIFLAVMVVSPAPLLWWLDVEKGREDARTVAERDEEGRGAYERVREE